MVVVQNKIPVAKFCAIDCLLKVGLKILPFSRNEIKLLMNNQSKGQTKSHILVVRCLLLLMGLEKPFTLTFNRPNLSFVSYYRLLGRHTFF